MNEKKMTERTVLMQLYMLIIWLICVMKEQISE